MSHWDKHRNWHEPNARWNLRRKFLETHKDSFSDEDYLLSLSNIFCNIKFLGCKYMDSVMVLIDKLSKGKKIDISHEIILINNMLSYIIIILSYSLLTCLCYLRTIH